LTSRRGPPDAAALARWLGFAEVHSRGQNELRSVLDRQSGLHEREQTVLGLEPKTGDGVQAKVGIGPTGPRRIGGEPPEEHSPADVRLDVISFGEVIQRVAAELEVVEAVREELVEDHQPFESLALELAPKREAQSGSNAEVGVVTPSQLGAEPGLGICPLPGGCRHQHDRCHCDDETPHVATSDVTSEYHSSRYPGRLPADQPPSTLPALVNVREQ